MPTFFVQLALLVISSLVAYLLAPKPQNAQPGKLSSLPIADQGAPVPVLFGTRFIKQPNVVWWGDVRTSPVQVSSGK